MSDSIEMHFCDLCGLSIPDRDLKEGLARRVGDKTVGACCVAKLSSNAKSVPVAAGAAGAAPVAAARPGDSRDSGSTSLLVAAIVVLVSVLGSAWLLDARMEERQREDRGELDQILAGRVDEIAEQFATLRREYAVVVREGLSGLRTELDGRLQKLESELVAVREAAASGIDAEKITGQFQRLQASLNELATRQGQVEKQVAGLGESLDARNRELVAGLVDLQRKAQAGALGGAPAEAEGGATPAGATKFETLPEPLGRRVDQLSSSDPGRRWEAVDELVRSGDKRVLPYLVPILKDPDPYVRKLTAEGFGKIGDVSFATALVDALEDEAAIVRMAAYRSLVKVSGKNFPFDPDASDAKRRSAVEKWREWAKDAKG